jgi:lysophospholipase L1-like esterase
VHHKPDWYHDANHNFHEYYAAMKELSDRFGVPFVDLNNPPGVANSDFVDGDHLSEPGAEIFSRYLAENVIAPRLP